MSEGAGAATRIAILFNGQLAGILEDGVVPAEAGLYRYRPVRSPAHLRMHETAERGERPLGSFTHGSRRFTFRLLAGAGLGRLAIEDIEVDGSVLGGATLR